MSSFWNFLFGAILILIWIIAGGFVTQANVYLSPYKNLDNNFHQAYWFTFWAAFVTWSLIGLFIVLVILSILGVVALFGSGVGEVGVAAEGAEGAEVEEAEFRSERANNSTNSPQYTKSAISWFTIGFLIFALILIGITGVLAAIAASDIIASSNYMSSNSKMQGAYNDCIIAASLCLGAGGILLIGIIVYLAIGIKRRREIKQTEEKEQEEIKQLRAQRYERELETARKRQASYYSSPRNY